jgi:hypothetical protein
MPPIELSNSLKPCNNRSQFKFTSFGLLSNNYWEIADGVGIHWPDVDLSFKGFSKRRIVAGSGNALYFMEIYF